MFTEKSFGMRFFRQESSILQCSGWKRGGRQLAKKVVIVSGDEPLISGLCQHELTLFFSNLSYPPTEMGRGLLLRRAEQRARAGDLRPPGRPLRHPRLPQGVQGRARAGRLSGEWGLKHLARPEQRSAPSSAPVKYLFAI